MSGIIFGDAMKQVHSALAILLGAFLCCPGAANAQEAHSGAIIGAQTPIPLPAKSRRGDGGRRRCQ
jgi:hypothetical protein